MAYRHHPGIVGAFIDFAAHQHLSTGQSAGDPLTSVSWTETGGGLVGSTEYLNIGDTVAITYQYTGTPHPTLTAGDYILLSNGAKAYLTSPLTSLGGTYTFTYTVAAGDTPGIIGLNNTTIYLPGGTPDPNAAGHYGNVTSSAPGVTYDVVPAVPVVASDSETTGRFHAGQTIRFTLNVNQPVQNTISNPTLTFEYDGHSYTAHFNFAASTTTKLVFTYTVPANPDPTNGAHIKITGITGFAAGDGPSDPLSIPPGGLVPAGNAQIICFMPGTLIRTPDGERTVESLSVGDLVLTAAGEAQPIRWIGRQTVSRVFADPLRVLPIRISAGALDENLPVRDLLVSPDHAMLVDGVLIQAGALVNSTTIRREADVPTVFTYYHVELADHALVLAEGAPAETFVDNIDRLGFDNWDEHLALYPEGQTVTEMPLPRAKAYRQVPMAVRARLAARASDLVNAERRLNAA